MASRTGRRSPSPSRDAPRARSSPSRSRSHGGPLPPSPARRSGSPSPRRSTSSEARQGGRSPPARSASASPPAAPVSMIRTMWGRLSGSKRRRSDREEPSSSPSVLPTAHRSTSTAPPAPHGSLTHRIWGRVTGAKRQRADDGLASPPPAPKRRQPSRSILIRSLWSEGLLGAILRGVTGAASLLRQSLPRAYIPDSILCLVLRLLPIRQMIRCSTVCKSFRSVICSDEFRYMCRSNKNFTGPLLAAFSHPYVSKSPVAVIHGPFSELQLSLDFAGRDFSFIADSRDGYLLMFTNLTPPYQRFSLCNPLTQVVMDLKMMPECNEFVVYIAASFVPDEVTNNFEVIVLYATSPASHMKTAIYNSMQDGWFWDDHDVAFAIPRCFLRIRQPSILVERQINFLFNGHHVISVDVKLSREICAKRSTQPNLQLRAVNLSHVPLPVEFQGAGIRLNINNLLGKRGGKLCFIGAPDDGGITIWSVHTTAEGDRVFDEPHEVTIAGQIAPRMMLLGFAEENEVIMVQRNSDSNVIVLINTTTYALSYLVRKIQELRLFAYEMEYPPTSFLHRHVLPPATE